MCVLCNGRLRLGGALIALHQSAISRVDMWVVYVVYVHFGGVALTGGRLLASFRGFWR